MRRPTAPTAPVWTEMNSPSLHSKLRMTERRRPSAPSRKVPGRASPRMPHPIMWVAAPS